MKTEDSGKTLDSWRALSRAYIRLTAGILLLVGLALVFTALDDEPLLQQRDALTGLSTRIILLLAGTIYVGLSIYLFVTRGLMTKGLLVSWLCLNLIIYRVGMNWMQMSNPNPAVILTGWKMGIWPRILDRYFIALIVYLAIGGLLVTVLEWRAARVHRLKTSASMQSSENLVA